MILWPKWMIRGCRLAGSDATASSRASLAAFIGELGVEHEGVLVSDATASSRASLAAFIGELGVEHEGVLVA